VVSYTPDISSYFPTSPIKNRIHWYDDPIEIYYPQSGQENHPWILNHAYYILFDQSLSWQKMNTPQLTLESFDVTPDPAWTLDENVGDPLARGWFFMGYSPPGYCKLATVYNQWPPPSGAGTYFDYRGPFHWFYWNEADPHQHYSELEQQYLVIIHTDDGRIYLPYDPTNDSQVFQNGEPDEIGVLEPGRGYFLGFKNAYGMNAGMDDFCWEGYPGWPSGELITPDPKETQPEIASASHFQFKAFTHFFYPIFIDTIALEDDTTSVGDEIGVFTPEGLCVGSTTFDGTFPLRLNAWKDDIATPDTVDGYQANQEMTFVLYDQSDNAEITFVPPPGTMASDDPIAPTHSGFGAGFYAWRSLIYGAQITRELPQEYGFGQNYPNPFNAETMIPLQLPQRSQVRVELFNIRGQSLGTVYDGVENAGWIKLRVNASGLSSGLYFYRIAAEGLERGGKFEDVGKMVVLK